MSGRKLREISGTASNAESEGPFSVISAGRLFHRISSLSLFLSFATVVAAAAALFPVAICFSSPAAARQEPSAPSSSSSSSSFFSTSFLS